MDPVTITEEKLETGLRGIPVGYCPTSKVDPMKGLSYCGMPIADLAYREPIDVIYLLLNRHFASDSELATFKADLKQRAVLPTGFREYLKTLPPRGHPMKWFVSSILGLGMLGCKDDYREDCLNLIAWMPEVAGLVLTMREGRTPNPSNPSLGYIENFVHVLNLSQGQERLTELMKVFDILHMDHGGGNLSTFAGKVVASGLEDMYGSIAAAMLGLAGPRHGMANQECLEFIKSIHSELGENSHDERAMWKYLETRYDNKELIFGFGHAVLRSEDPRATVLFELGEKLCPEDKYFKTAKILRKVGTEFLKTKEKIQDPYVNVDSASGAVLNACGLTDPSYYTVLFGFSRVVGIAIQIVYERLEARGGKGTPIVRPKYIYSGPAPS